jgi:3',5'-cyclic AMP phosphodiesterase CpdA
MWRIIVIFISMLAVSCSSKSSDEKKALPLELPKVTYSTLNKTYREASEPTANLAYDDLDGIDAAGYGLIKEMPGEPHLLRSELAPAGWNAPGSGRKPLLLLAHISDIHITDEESPMRMCKANFIDSAFRPHELYATHLLDAAIRTINGVADKTRVDLVLDTGDNTDNTQGNEAAWLVSVIAGETVSPDSGAKDDPVPGPGNDYQDPFLAAGLRMDIPYIVALGNHNGQTLGNWKPDTAADDKQNRTYGEIAVSGTVLNSALGGTRDGSTLNGTILAGGSKVPADMKRRQLVRGEFYKNMLMAIPQSVTGLYSQEADANHELWFKYSPKAGVPVTVIGIDMGKSGQGSDGGISRKMFDNFLKKELASADADGRVVVLASHHGSDSLQDTTEVGEQEFVTEVASHPSVILHLTGHGHENKVRARSAGGRSYWEMEAPSILDWPNQFRFVELVYNGDGTVSIFATDMDVPVGGLTANVKKWTLAHAQIFGLVNGEGTIQDRNVEMVIPVSAKAASNLASAAVEELASKTVLSGEINLK